MKIAVVSDSHDRVELIERAFQRINQMGIDHVIHLGDVVSPFTAQWVARAYHGKLTIIFGNNDGDKFGLIEKYGALGAEFHHPPVALRLGDIRVAAMHEPMFLDFLAATGQFQVVLWGHTHRAEIRHEEGVLLVNPGELCGYLTGRASFAVVDLEGPSAELVEL